MSNSGKIWDTREAYQKQRANTWETPGNRGMRMGGQTTPGASESNTVEFVDMISTGNTADFGDLTQARKKGAGAGGFTRVLCLGGQTPSNVNTIDFVNPVSTGDFSDFGDLVNAGQTTNTSHCNNIKTISADGSGDADGIVITHMASQGNSSFFQNRTNIDTQWASGTGSNTRFLICGKYPANNQIDAMEIATTGTKFDFGNLTSSRWGVGTASNSTRSVFMGGNVTPGTTNVIDFVTTASAGDATDFGDLTASVYQDSAGASNSKSAIVFGYQNNTINTINIATTGNATDFGDTLTSTFYQIMGADNGGGGLPQEGAFPQRASVNYMPGSGRGFINPGTNSGGSGGSINRLQMIFVPTLGNALDFGDLTTARQLVGATNSITRSCVAGGETPSAQTNLIDYYEMQSLGNASDFGDLTVTRRSMSNGGTNGSRGTFHGGNTPSLSNVIDYITISSVGNATDFGNLTVARDGAGTLSSPTRTLSGGGGTPSKSNVIDYITTASTGDATDFGDLTVARNLNSPVSSTTRGAWIAGYGTSPATRTDTIDYVTIASTGNATDFGDLAQARAAGAGISNNIRGLHAGGEVPGTDTTQIEFITIATTGNSSDFGDLVEACQYLSGTCDANSGLQSA